MPKVTFSKTAIINLADYVLKNYGHINETVEAGITATQKTYTNIKLTSLAVYSQTAYLPIHSLKKRLKSLSIELTNHFFLFAFTHAHIFSIGLRSGL